MGSFSMMHWGIVAIVVLLLFGRGAISSTMTDIGKGMKQLRGIAEDDHVG